MTIDFTKTQIFGIDVLRQKLGLPALEDSVSEALTATKTIQETQNEQSNQTQGRQEEVQVADGTPASVSEFDAEVVNPQVQMFPVERFAVQDSIFHPDQRNQFDNQVFNP